MSLPIGLIFALLIAAPLAAAERAAGAGQAPTAVEGATANDAGAWPYTLPFLADEAIKRGYELPLPLGLSAIYYYVERDIEITDIRVGVNGAPLRDVNKFINLGSKSHVSVALARLDAWLLPFLDVYGLLGYVSNNTTTQGAATIPTLGPRPGSRTFELSARTRLNGFVGGAGLTAVGGYREFFLLGDLNYSQTDIGFDDKFRALIGTIRAGWNGKIVDIPTRVWVGAMYWGTRSTAKSTVDVADVGAVSFEADQGPVHPLNAVVGGSVNLFRRWDAFLEYGFNGGDVHAVSAGLSFRF